MQDIKQVNDRTPSVTVIIPAYNAAPFIRETLDSVLAQTFQDFQIVVVNDGSPDTEQLEQVLEPYLSRIIYIRQENGGPGSARNAGLRATSSEFVALIDSDDLWEPDYLETQLRFMYEEPKPALVYSNAINFGSGETVGRTFMDVSPSEGEATFEALLSERCTVMVSVTARREAIVAAGMFSEERALIGHEDFDLWLRIAKLGGRIVYHRRPLVRRRFWRGQLTSQLIPFYESLVRTLDRVGQTMELTSAQEQLLEERKFHHRAMLSLIRGKEALIKEDGESAYQYLAAANQYFRRPKISLVLFILRLLPTFVFSVSRRIEANRLRNAQTQSLI